MSAPYRFSHFDADADLAVFVEDEWAVWDAQEVQAQHRQLEEERAAEWAAEELAHFRLDLDKGGK